jgi:hypothetical protein
MKMFPAALVAVLCLAVPGLASGENKPSPFPAPAEKEFVASVSDELTTRFATEDEARAAGYIRFTDEDSSGAISFANRKWTSVDAAHPSQLWYSAGGRLIGADYSVLQADSPKPPNLFGINPARWQTIEAHVHYGLAGPDGTTIYGGTGEKTMAAAGSSVAHPSAAALVTAGIAKSVKDVRFVFTFPAIWDLQVWVIPNPDGAFADNNPKIVPVHPTSM